MIRVNITELRRNLPTFLDRVVAGEQVEITRRGQVIALMTPVTDARREARRRLSDLRKKARVGDVESPVIADWEVSGDSP